MRRVFVRLARNVDRRHPILHAYRVRSHSREKHSAPPLLLGASIFVRGTSEWIGSVSIVEPFYAQRLDPQLRQLDVCRDNVRRGNLHMFITCFVPNASGARVKITRDLVVVSALSYRHKACSASLSL
jgi:hypothetical protein